MSDFMTGLIVAMSILFWWVTVPAAVIMLLVKMCGGPKKLLAWVLKLIER